MRDGQDVYPMMMVLLRRTFCLSPPPFSTMTGGLPNTTIHCRLIIRRPLDPCSRETLLYCVVRAAVDLRGCCRSCNGHLAFLPTTYLPTCFALPSILLSAPENMIVTLTRCGSVISERQAHVNAWPAQECTFACYHHPDQTKLVCEFSFIRQAI
jgi:hypothetical protein